MQQKKISEPETQQVELCRRLREAIILGRLHGGQRITEKFISDEMGVKRGPARESLLILEGQGLVRKVPSLGYFIESHTEEEIQDVYEIRTALETLAVRRAAVHATREDLIRLQLACNAMRAALDTGDAEKRVREDLDFHAALVQASGSRILKHAYDALPRPFYGPTQLGRRKAERVAQQHEAVYQAIRERNPEKAAEMLAVHISEHDKTTVNGNGKAAAPA